MKKCPTCQSEAKRVIYMGFPVWLCSDDGCNTLWGFWSWVPGLYFNGAFMEYEGSYWPALWHWLFGSQE
jgi:hypothetical protein